MISFNLFDDISVDVFCVKFMKIMLQSSPYQCQFCRTSTFFQLLHISDCNLTTLIENKEH